jgi:hypothetical protein
MTLTTIADTFHSAASRWHSYIEENRIVFENKQKKEFFPLKMKILPIFNYIKNVMCIAFFRRLKF